MKAKIIFVLLCLFLLASCGGQMKDTSENGKSMDTGSEYPQPPAQEPPSQSPYEQATLPAE